MSAYIIDVAEAFVVFIHGTTARNAKSLAYLAIRAAYDPNVEYDDLYAQRVEELDLKPFTTENVIDLVELGGGEYENICTCEICNEHGV